MEITVESLQKVKLEKGDVLIVTFDMDNITDEDMEESKKTVKNVFPKNKIIYTPKEIELSVITKEIIDD